MALRDLLERAAQGRLAQAQARAERAAEALSHTEADWEQHAAALVAERQRDVITYGVEHVHLDTLMRRVEAARVVRAEAEAEVADSRAQAVAAHRESMKMERWHTREEQRHADAMRAEEQRHADERSAQRKKQETS